MIAENINPYSIFKGRLHDLCAVIAHGSGADDLIFASHSAIRRHNAIQGLGIFSPNRQRTPGLDAAAKELTIPTLWVATNTDKHRPIHNAMPLYNQVKMGELPLGVCKTYVEIEGGNHCFHTDWFKYHIPWTCRDEHQYDLKDQVWSHTAQMDEVVLPLLIAWLDFTVYKNRADIDS